jgi:hypothetical protein
MAKTLVGALVLALAPTTLAFRNTSPYFLFSTADLSIDGDHVQVASAPRVLRDFTQLLTDCPSKTYFVVEQQGVSSDEYLHGPRMGRYLAKENGVRSTKTIAEVVETHEERPLAMLTSYLEEHCGAIRTRGAAREALKQSSSPRVLEISRASNPQAAAVDSLDLLIDELIRDVAENKDYTVIYTTTPSQGQAKAALDAQHTYEMEDSFSDAVQMELKRDLSSHKRATSVQGGLFEKYQYFTPAIFMGLVAILPLFLVLFVGMRALASLQVSYFAFSKEMGPQAQRK